MIESSSSVIEADRTQRAQDVWREWLLALARDPEAAHAAALAYRGLGAEERDQWLTTLEQDSSLVVVPKIAVYAPLMAVEADKQRRRRMEFALSTCRFVSYEAERVDETQEYTTENSLDSASGAAQLSPAPQAMAVAAQARGLLARDASGVHLAVLIGPLYLGFVQVLACAFNPGQRFLWVRHDPIARDDQAPRAGVEFEGMKLQSEPLPCIIDELARTIVAHRRADLPLPEALRLFADWFSVARFGDCEL